MNKTLNWWNKLNVFNKTTIISLFYSAIAIIVSLILMIVNNTFIYGTLVGILILFISYLIVWSIWFTKGKSNKDGSGSIITLIWFMPIIRALIFITSFLTIILVINPALAVGSHDNKSYVLLTPINILSFLLTYGIPAASGFTLLIIDMFNQKDKEYFIKLREEKEKLEKENNKNKKKDKEEE